MATKFLSQEGQYHAGVNVRTDAELAPEQLELEAPGAGPEGVSVKGGSDVGVGSREAPFAIQNDQDAPPCSTCGAIMIRNGSCYKCVNCGATSGCA